jgi:hypothetical protein
LECVAAIFGGSREEVELKGGDGGIFAANMTGTESQEAAVVTEVIILLDKALLEEETIKRLRNKGLRRKEERIRKDVVPLY